MHALKVNKISNKCIEIDLIHENLDLHPFGSETGVKSLLSMRCMYSKFHYPISITRSCQLLEQ